MDKNEAVECTVDQSDTDYTFKLYILNFSGNIAIG